MSIKYFSDLYTDLAHRLKISIDDPAMLSDVKNWINTAYKEFQLKGEWYWRKGRGQFKLEKMYDTGSLTATQGNQTLTGSGTSWTSSMVGAYIQLDGDSSYYKIIAVGSAVSITIDSSYIDTTRSGSYKIWKRAYDLISDVESIDSIYTEFDQNRKLATCDFMMPFITGLPTAYRISGIKSSSTTYTTGTCSGTTNTKTLTGASTAWLANAQSGDEITIGSYVYNILSVDSDTQITLAQKLIATVTASTSYSIERKDLIQIEFNYTPSEDTMIYYDYLKKTYDMQNAADEPNMPEAFRDVIVLGAIVTSYQYLGLEGGAENQSFAKRVYDRRVQEIKQKVENEKSEPMGFYW